MRETNSLKPKAWVVEMLLGHDWHDAEWMMDEKPMRFATKEAAEAEIDEFIRDANREGLDYSRDAYRAAYAPLNG